MAGFSLVDPFGQLRGNDVYATKRISNTPPNPAQSQQSASSINTGPSNAPSISGGSSISRNRGVSTFDYFGQNPTTMNRWDSAMPMRAGYIPMNQMFKPYMGTDDIAPPKSAPSPDFLPGQTQQLAPWPSIAGKTNVPKPQTQPQTQTGPMVSTTPTDYLSRGGVTGNMSNNNPIDVTPTTVNIPGMTNFSGLSNPGNGGFLGSSPFRSRLFY